MYCKEGGGVVGGLMGPDGKTRGLFQMLDYFSQHVPSAPHAPCASRHMNVPTINELRTVPECPLPWLRTQARPIRLFYSPYKATKSN